MNEIPTKQNEPASIELLLAQRRLYAKAKTCFTWRISIALLFGIAGPIVAVTFISTNVFVGVLSIIYFFVNLLVLERFESAHKDNAAKLQEVLDVRLFELPWNEYVTGKRPDAELIAKALEGHHNEEKSDLKDWYPSIVGKAPIGFARLVCQRSNAWWDTSLRRRYIWFLGATSLAVIAILVAAAGFAELTIVKFLLGIILPALPFAEVVIQQIRHNNESSCLTTELKENIDHEITKAIEGDLDQNSLNISRVFQDQIFRHRRHCPMVFDWIQKMAKPTYEKRMQFSAAEKIHEFMKKNMQ